MRDQDALQRELRENPESFEILREYALFLYGADELRACFALTERAIASYDKAPNPLKQPQYFELKRLRHQLVRNHLDLLMGESWPLLDSRWPPVFKLGRPREMAWHIDSHNMDAVEAALRSDQLRRLRYLSVTITEAPDAILKRFHNLRLSTLRALNLTFLQDPSRGAFGVFWEATTQVLAGLLTLSMRMTRLSDAMALMPFRLLHHLQSLNFISLDRSGLTPSLCDALASDKRSNQLVQLGIVGSCLGDSGLLTLLTSDNFAALQALDLQDGLLSNAAARLISAETHLPKLRSLDLRYNQIDEAGIAILSRNQTLTIRSEGQHSRPPGR
ncbi:MAG: hypothetical protein FWC40_09775 [Proteobacteria bacterium]|nr:hypothetical protein [Pseudomonadota bacterium]